MTILRTLPLIAAAALTVLVRRLRGRSRCASWSLRQEIAIDVLRRNGRLLMRLEPSVARGHMAALTPRSEHDHEVVRESVVVDGLAGEWVRPKGKCSDDVVILYIRGGGYVFGIASMYKDIEARLAVATGARVLGVEYRQAPEATFPAAVEDATRAYRWLRARGVDASRIVLCGDSSGGALAVTTLLVLRDLGEELPAAAALISPWMDLEAASDSVDTNATLDWGGREYLRHWATLYLGDEAASNPLASPIRARLEGLPPLFITVGSAEVLRDEVVQFADLARAAGVRTQLTVVDNMVHGWVLSPALFPEAHDTIRSIAAFVRQFASSPT